MIQRLALLAVSAIALAMPLTLIGGHAHAEGIEVERQCQNGVCGQAKYVNGKVQITVSTVEYMNGHFNFKTNPGEQIELSHSFFHAPNGLGKRGDYSFDRSPGDSGTYSVQACSTAGGGFKSYSSTCRKWATFNWTSGPKPLKSTGRAPTPPPLSRTGRSPRPSAEDTAAREAEAALIVADRQVTGKSPAQCEASRSRCFNQCQARGVGAAEVCQLQECQPIFVQCSANANLNRGDGPATTFVTVIKSVDLYADKFGEGGKLGFLRKGARGVVLVEPCADDWCRVESRNGSGWVYNGEDYRSLRIP